MEYLDGFRAGLINVVDDEHHRPTRRPPDLAHDITQLCRESIDVFVTGTVERLDDRHRVEQWLQPRKATRRGAIHHRAPLPKGAASETHRERGAPRAPLAAHQCCQGCTLGAGEKVVEPRRLRVQADQQLVSRESHRERGPPCVTTHPGRALDREHPCGARRRRDPVELRPLHQDRLLETPQRRARIDPQRLRELRTYLAVRAQRVRLTSRSVQGEHELTPEPLPVRELRHQRVELDRHLVVASQAELCLNPLLDRHDSEFLEPHCLGARELLGCKLGECGTAPQRQRLVERGERGVRVPSLRAMLRVHDELLELCCVVTLPLDRQDIARRACHQHVERTCRADQRAQPMHELLERAQRGRRRPLPPECLDQPVGRDH